MIASPLDIRPRIPDDIVQIVISPESYANDAVGYGAFRWLRENMPLGVAQVPGFDPIWIVTKHANIKEVERNTKLYHNADPNSILNGQASDAFTRGINVGSLRIISSLTLMDSPEHAAYRSLTSNWFLSGKIGKLEEQIKALAKKSVEHLLSFNDECDFVRGFALHYPFHVIMTLFGVQAKVKADPGVIPAWWTKRSAGPVRSSISCATRAPIRFCRARPSRRWTG